MDLHASGAFDPAILLEAALDSLDTWTCALDGGGRVLLANAAWRAYQGPNPFVAGLEPGGDYAARVRGLTGSPDGNVSIVALGLQAVLAGKVPRLRLEFPLKAEGGQLWFSVVAIREERGGAPLILLHHGDLTERTQAIQRLHRVESLFKATTDNAMDLISVLDKAGRFLYTSHSHQKILGYGTPDWSQGFLDGLLHPEDREAYLQSLKDGFRTGLSPLFEYRILHAGGAWKTFEGRAAVIEGGPAAQETILLISRDITVRKQAELERSTLEVQLRQAQKLEAVGQLAAGIAHEINTPTQYISDNVRFLEEAFTSLCDIVKEESGLLAEATRDSALADRASSILERIQREDLDYLLDEVPKAIQQSMDGLGRVSAIVKAMKVFSHPGTEGQVALDLNQAIENTVLVARNEWKYVADLETELEPGLPAVTCFPGEINQVILNLVINAAHAIEAVVGGTGGKGRITVGTRHAADAVEIRVADTGTGIPAAIRERVFLPFFTTKPVGKGTGQGLSIVHSVVTRHGGTVDFESEEGKGTTFLVRLPIRA
jgi:PAS domain S-box-containing protein